MRILINRKLAISQLNKFFLALAIMSIPMQPIFTTYGFNACIVVVVVLTASNVINKKGKIFLSNFDWQYFAFIAFNMLSLIWSSSGAIYITGEMLVYFCFVFSIENLLFTTFNGTKAVEFYARWYVIGTLIVSIVCLIYEWPNYLGSARLGKMLFVEPYGTFMMYSYSLQISAIIVIYNIIVEKHKKNAIILSAFLIVCILFNGSRKVLAGLLLFYLIASFIYNKEKTFILIKNGCMVLIVVAILLYLVINNETLYNSYGYRIVAFLDYKNTGRGDVSALERELLISRAFNYFTERPILGWGAHSFAYLYEINFGKNIYAHNNFIELLCDLGIIGFTMYYSIYVVQIWRFIKVGKKKYIVYGSKYTILFLAGLITILILDYWTISYYRIQFLLFLEIAATYLHYLKTSIKSYGDFKT